jgi:hypothetical protein
MEKQSCYFRAKYSMSSQKQDSSHKVLFYEGYKGRESPRAVLIGNKELKIDKIIWRKRVKDQKSGKILEIHMCRIDDQYAKISIHESGRAEVTFKADKE